jgi:hypothetical protein
MLGNLGRSARCIVGDEQDARADYRERLDGTVGGFMAAKDRAVKIEK